MVFIIAVGMAKTNEILSHHVNKTKKIKKKFSELIILENTDPKLMRKQKIKTQDVPAP